LSLTVSEYTAVVEYGYESALRSDVSAWVVLQNADSTANGKGDPGAMAMLLGAYALGDPYPEAKPIAVSAETLKAAQGVYRIDADNTRVLRVVDGKLTSQRTGGAVSALIPTATDTSVFEGSLNWFKLERDPSGKITGMRMYPDGEGEGVVCALTDEPLPGTRASITLPREQLQRVVGTYRSSGVNMKVFMDGDQLKTQLDGQPAFDLFAETPNRFFLTVVDAPLSFAPDTGAVTRVTLNQGPAVIEFQRVD